MTYNACLANQNISNEHIKVCPECGRESIVIYSKTAFKSRRTLKPYYCRHCKKGLDKITNLQDWLMKRFDETREKEKRGEFRLYE